MNYELGFADYFVSTFDFLIVKMDWCITKVSTVHDHSNGAVRPTPDLQLCIANELRLPNS